MPEGNSTTEYLPAAQRLFAPGKKRILTLDGGGVRGAVTLAFLEEMERQLRQETRRKNLVLADVFDLIAGTSVGSMFATMLALGKEVGEIKDAFLDLAPRIFTGRPTLLGPRRFDATPLVNGVRKYVGDERLGSDKLRTGLVIIAKRVDTGSVWVLSNNPRMPFYEDGPNWDGNKRYKLESLVRASTAAPFLFTPTRILIHTDRNGNEVYGWFVDGGVSPLNNPCMQALMMAGLPSYNLNWTLSENDLLMISVGTGLYRTVIDPTAKVITGIARLIGKRNCEDIEQAAFAMNTLRSVVSDNVVYMLKAMQAVSHPRFGWTINSEVKAFEGELLTAAMKPAGGPLLRFQRYDLPLEKGSLVAPEYDVAATQAERTKLQAMDDASIIPELTKLAEEAAMKQVSMVDFAGFI